MKWLMQPHMGEQKQKFQPLELKNREIFPIGIPHPSPLQTFENLAIRNDLWHYDGKPWQMEISLAIPYCNLFYVS